MNYIGNYRTAVSIGAICRLVASGDIELLENDELKRELAAFFGSFEDLRESERLLLDTQLIFVQSGAFSRIAGWHRLGVGGLPAAGKVPLEQWSRSDEFMNGVGILTVRQLDVLDDYEFLRTRINNIGEAIAAKASDPDR